MTASLDRAVEAFCADFFGSGWPSKSTHNDEVIRGMVSRSLAAALPHLGVDRDALPGRKVAIRTAYESMDAYQSQIDYALGWNSCLDAVRKLIETNQESDNG